MKLHILPSVFAAMGEEEKAFVIASIQIKAKNDEEKKKEAERKAKRGK